MREDIKTVTIFGLIVIVGLLLVSTLYFAKEYSSQKDKTATAKRAALFVPLSYKSKRKDVLKLFNTRIKFPDKGSTSIVWQADGQTIYEDDFFAQFGITKESDKKKIRKELFKQGAKRFLQTCNQLYGPKSIWSLGYCTLDPYPQEQAA